jgi:hypothetical protein
VLFHRKYPSATCHINAAIFDSIPFTKADLATSWQSSHVMTLRFEGGGNVRGYPSVSLLHTSSPTLQLCICTHPPHLCTILKDYTHSRQLLGPIVRRLPAPPSTHTSTALDGLRTHWDRSA